MTFHLEKKKKNFKKYKNILIELFITHYGEENREKIEHELDKTYIFFQSTPTDDWIFVQNHIEQFTHKKVKIYKERAHIYEKKEQKILDETLEKFTQFIIKHIPIVSDNPRNRETLIQKVFTYSNLSPDYARIDRLSSLRINLLNTPTITIPQNVRWKIIDRQEQTKDYLSYLGYNPSHFTPEVVDKIIAYRKAFNALYRMRCVQETNFLTKKIKKVNKNQKITCPPLNLGRFLYLTNPKNLGIWDKTYTEHRNLIHIPLSYLDNNRFKGLDVTLIHEFIHSIETNPRNPLLSNNNWLNEMRTQRLAIHLTKKLHEMGYFIFDDPEDYKVEGECLYENFFVFVADFFDRYEPFLSKKIVAGEANNLIGTFGIEWEYFCKLVNATYNQFLACYKFLPSSQYSIYISNDYKDLISKMDENYQKVKQIKRL